MFKKLFLFFIIIILLFGLCNKSFFSNEYKVINEYNNTVFLPINKFSIFLDETDKNINFLSLQSEKSNNKFIQKYLSKLESCYDGKYYYDQNRNISIYEYSYSNHKITIKYADNNICAKEHVLDSNWSSKFIDAHYESITYNGNNIDEEKFLQLIENIKLLEKSKISYDVETDEKVLKAKFTKNNKTYECEIFMYNKKFLVLKIINNKTIKIAKFSVFENYLDSYIN